MDTEMTCYESFAEVTEDFYCSAVDVLKILVLRLHDYHETHPADRLRQCVFGGSSNTMDFLPLDRSGNRRFLPIMVHPENAEIHILEDEAASRAFIDMMWAEVMFIYQNFPVKLTLSKDMDKELKELQKQFMPEDTKAGLIQSFLDNFKGTQVCSKLIYAEALNHPFDEPKQWEIREINEIMNNSMNRLCLTQKSRLCVQATLASGKRWTWTCRWQN